MRNILTRRIWPVLRETFRRWNANDGMNLAAAMAYYSSLSFFPLLLVLLAALGYTLRFWPTVKEAARDQLLVFVEGHTSTSMAEQIDAVLNQLQGQAGFGGSIGLATMFIGAIGIFTQLTATFDRIWHKNSPPLHGITGILLNALRYRVAAFASLLGLGLLVLSGSVFSTIQSHIVAIDPRLDGEGWKRFQLLAGIVLNALAFMLLYKLLPRATVRWTHALWGGLVVAIVWELGRRTLAWVVVHSNYTAYGFLGSFLAMMLWAYYASLLVFLGAQLVQVLGYPNDDH